MYILMLFACVGRNSTMLTWDPFVTFPVPSLANSLRSQKRSLTIHAGLGKQKKPKCTKETSRLHLGLPVLFVSYRRMKALHDKYGTIIKLSPDTIAISDKDWIKEILVKDDLPKGPTYSALQCK